MSIARPLKGSVISEPNSIHPYRLPQDYIRIGPVVRNRPGEELIRSAVPAHCGRTSLHLSIPRMPIKSCGGGVGIHMDTLELKFVSINLLSTGGQKPADSSGVFNSMIAISTTI